ncbi:MAG: PIN domain-containing protein [Pyrinomonadaceae bacterium]
MRVLLDTDVVLDYLLEREPFAEPAGQLFELIAQGTCDGYVSGITPINVFYIGRKDKGIVKARESVGYLLTAVRVCPVNHAVLNGAFALPFADYEDAVQHACATQPANSTRLSLVIWKIIKTRRCRSSPRRTSLIT